MTKKEDTHRKKQQLLKIKQDFQADLLELWKEEEVDREAEKLFQRASESIPSWEIITPPLPLPSSDKLGVSDKEERPISSEKNQDENEQESQDFGFIQQESIEVPLQQPEYLFIESPLVFTDACESVPEEEITEISLQDISDNPEEYQLSSLTWAEKKNSYANVSPLENPQNIVCEKALKIKEFPSLTFWVSYDKTHPEEKAYLMREVPQVMKVFSQMPFAMEVLEGLEGKPLSITFSSESVSALWRSKEKSDAGVISPVFDKFENKAYSFFNDQVDLNMFTGVYNKNYAVGVMLHEMTHCAMHKNVYPFIIAEDGYITGLQDLVALVYIEEIFAESLEYYNEFKRQGKTNCPYFDQIVRMYQSGFPNASKSFIKKQTICKYFMDIITRKDTNSVAMKKIQSSADTTAKRIGMTYLNLAREQGKTISDGEERVEEIMKRVLSIQGISDTLPYDKLQEVKKDIKIMTNCAKGYSEGNQFYISLNLQEGR